MRRLEIIHLRWTGPRSTDVLQTIRETLIGLGARGRVEVYRHEAVPTDVGIHLRHGGDQTEPDLAILGTRLVAALREVGMVEHSVWIGQEGL